MHLSSAYRGAALAGIFLVSGLLAATAQGDGFGYLPYPGDRGPGDRGPAPGETGLYASLRGSMAFAGKDGATTVPTTPTPVALRGSHDTGYGGSIVLGGHLPLGFKVELEGLYRRRPYENINLGGISSAASGFRDVAAPMGNLLWEMPIDGVPIRPFIGGGAGMAYTHSRLQDPAGGTIYKQNSNWRFAWQGMAGLKIDIAPGARLSAMYRYFQVDDVVGRCGIAGQAPALACSASNTDQSVDLGLELDL